MTNTQEIHPSIYIYLADGSRHYANIAEFQRIYTARLLSKPGDMSVDESLDSSKLILDTFHAFLRDNLSIPPQLQRIIVISRPDDNDPNTDSVLTWKRRRILRPSDLLQVLSTKHSDEEVREPLHLLLFPDLHGGEAVDCAHS